MVKFANNDKSKLCCASLDGTVSICNVIVSPPQFEILRGHKKGVTGKLSLFNTFSYFKLLDLNGYGLEMKFFWCIH